MRTIVDDFVAPVFGYMTAESAAKQGFTHHGRYYGIPVWLSATNEDFAVATKWAPLEYLMTAFHWIEGFLHSTMFPNEPHVFRFLMGKEIGK